MSKRYHGMDELFRLSGVRLPSKARKQYPARWYRQEPEGDVLVSRWESGAEARRNPPTQPGTYYLLNKIRLHGRSYDTTLVPELKVNEE